MREIPYPDDDAQVEQSGVSPVDVVLSRMGGPLDSEATKINRLAELIGCTPQYIYGWKRRGEVPVGQCKAVAQATGLRLSEINPSFFDGIQTIL